MLKREDAHEDDINVIHWNRKDPFIASGGDDCTLRVWDLRSFNDTCESVAEFKHHHKAPICSVEWSPHESSVLATCGEDDQVAIWDLAVERDPEEKAEEEVVRIERFLVLFFFLCSISRMSYLLFNAFEWVINYFVCFNCEVCRQLR